MVGLQYSSKSNLIIATATCNSKVLVVCNAEEHGQIAIAELQLVRSNFYEVTNSSLVLIFNFGRCLLNFGLALYFICVLMYPLHSCISFLV